MIRLTRISDYGILLMTLLAARGGHAPRNARQVATAARLPLPVVRKILKVLTREGLLASHRGSKGGYSLARSPEQISAAEMIAALDGPIGLTECAIHPGQCGQEASCHVREPWQRINAVVQHALSSVTLADLARPAPDNALLYATGANLALEPVAAMPPVTRQATVADDRLDGDVGRVVLLPPLCGHLLQRGAVVCLGGDVGRAVGADQSTVSNDFVHQMSSLKFVRPSIWYF